MRKVWGFACLGIFAAACVLRTIYEYNGYTAGKIKFTVNNKKTSCVYISDLKDELENNTVTLLDGIDISKSVKLEADIDNLNNIGFLEYIKLKDKNVDIDINISEIDTEILRDILIDYNNNSKSCEDATIEFNIDTQRYEVVQEVMGDKIDINKIIAQINKDITNINELKLSDFLVLPRVTKDDLQEIVDEANKFLDWHVDYENGQSFETPSSAVSIQDNKVTVDNSFIKDVIKELEKEYDKVGKERTFSNHEGIEITVSGGTWGTIMNSKLETEALTEMFGEAKSEENRKPIMIQDYTEIGDKYIEISLDEQHLWVYEDGEVIMETDIVTGDILKGRGTPAGTYFISERIGGKYLTGDGYKVWVDRWMRLTNTGIGLHDAGNRRSFGGTIYKGNGSHGCINLPRDFAYDLFDEAYRGMAVIIY